jgi:hypothetical protein
MLFLLLAFYVSDIVWINIYLFIFTIGIELVLT